MELSFVDEKTVVLKKVETRDELLDLISKCRANETYKLSNLDLSQIKDCCNLDFDGLKLDNIIFSRFNPESQQKKIFFMLSFMGSTLNRVSFAQSYLQQCNFDTMDKDAISLHREKVNNKTPINDNTKEVTSKLTEVDFFFSKLEYCRFRLSNLNTVDFRYSHLVDCSMGEINVDLGDFYNCAFEGCTNFIRGRFTNCSFTNATFEYNCLRMSNIPEGIVQEYSEKYHKDLILAKEWMKYNPCASYSSMNHESNKKEIEYNTKSQANIALEASNFYKELSGTLAGKGFFNDSNIAYKKSKEQEVKFCKLELLLPVENRKCLDGKKSGADQVYKRRLMLDKCIRYFGYGYKWTAPVYWFLGIVAFFAALTTLFNGLSSFFKMLSWSLNNSMSPYEHYTSLFENFLEDFGVFISSLESIAGVLLIGFLGFVIANKIRNNT